MKTKNIFRILLCAIVLSSCNYLDFDESIGYEEEDMYAYFGRTKGLLTGIYTAMDQDWGVVDGAIRACATDDAEYVWSTSNVQGFNNGSWSAINILDSRWSTNYTAIRAANKFLVGLESADYSRFEYNDDYNDWMTRIENYPYEARLLRAIYFFDLAKRYGDIPMPLTALSMDEVNEIKETPFDDVIDYIVSECNDCKQYLPATYVGTLDGETGRVTKGVAMALKSRALLYAASPLHNTSNDVQKWKDAATAANDLIKANVENSWYSLEGIGVNPVNNINSKEAILIVRNAASNVFEAKNFPIGVEGGKTGACPTQNLVDAFETKNGFAVKLTSAGWVSDDPEFDAASPYANRDPRFAKTIAFDGADWKDGVVESFLGGKNGAPLTGATPTGYYLKKYLIKAVNLTPQAEVSKEHFWVSFRYAEILLNYAEAMNEAFGPDYTDATFGLSATDALNLIRERATMPLVSGLSKDAFRIKLQNERRVELAFENHRIWDVRRWKIGVATQTIIAGVDIVKNADETKSYSYKVVETRTWNDKMNLFPIPQNELFKNENLSQNEGW